jgi:hypothetical protein
MQHDLLVVDLTIYPPSDLGDVQVRVHQGKGVGWDPPIHATNNGFPHGMLINKLGPMYHLGEKCVNWAGGVVRYEYFYWNLRPM